MARFTAHSIYFAFLDENGSGITPVTLGAITSSSHPLNTETVGDDSGSIYDEARSIVSQLPEPVYTTKSIQTILAVAGVNGQCFSSDGSNPGVYIYGQVIQDCGNNPAATANLRYVIPKGLIRIQSLSVDRVGDAVCTFTIDALTDGSNAPFAGSYSGITLPTNAVSEKYGIGAFRIGNILWSEPRSWNLDFGIQIDDKLPALAQVWADTVGVRNVNPVLSISGRDPTMLDDSTGIPLLGKQALHTNSVLQLVKRVRSGSYYPYASTVHFRATLDGLAVINDPFSTSGAGEAELSARVELTHDGTNAPIVPAFNQAYSASAV